MLGLLDSTQVGSGHKDSSVTSIPRTCISCRLIPNIPQISTIRCLLSVFPAFLVSLYAEKPIQGIYPFVSCVPCTSLRHTYVRHENPCFRHFRLPLHHVMERARNCHVPDASGFPNRIRRVAWRHKGSAPYAEPCYTVLQIGPITLTVS